MCVPGCQDAVHRALSRRGFFRGAGLAAAGAAATALPVFRAEAAAPVTFTKVVDLTHVLSPEFPTFFGKPGIEFETKFAFKKDGFNFLRWNVDEHTATHFDAPLHFTENGPDVSTLKAENLVAPLAVINVVEKAAANPDYLLTPDDVKAWEARNGRLPDGAAVALNSGWDKHLGTPKYTGLADKTFHFPGFHPETAEFLVKERVVVGLVVDTLSLDHGPSEEFKAHLAWLPTGRWGLENAANLGELPEKGATIVAGAPKVKGATGGPGRVFALL